MSYLTDRLRKLAVRIADQYGTDGSNTINDPDRLYFAAHDAADALDAAEAKLAAIDALHQPDDVEDYWTESNDPYCLECDIAWPCPTHHILHPEETE